MSFRRLILIAVLLSPATLAAADKLRLCTDVNPHPPYLMPDGGGRAGLLAAHAARAAGLELEYLAVPLARCRAEVGVNALHGYPMTPYDAALLPLVQYPMRNGVPDSARATLHARVVLFKRRGDLVSWDGVALTGLVKPVLLPSGSVAMQRAVDALRVTSDSNGQSMERNFAKLLAGRGDLVVGFEDEGALLMQDPRFAGKVERLPMPLYEQTYYLAISKTYYAQNGAAVEAMWDAIGRLNQAAKTLEK